MRRISKVANVSHSGPMSPMRLIVCDAKILDTVLSAVTKFSVSRNKNQQMRLISKDLGKLVSSKTNVGISSYDRNNHPKVQKGSGSLMMQFPLSGVLLSEQE